jgi:hypothetical protein
MKRLFSPCTRFRDTVERRERSRLGPREILQELNLDVSIEELLRAERAFTYADLYAVLRSRKKIAWLTPHALVVTASNMSVVKCVLYSWRQVEQSCHFSFKADGKDIRAMARSPEHLLEICDAVLRLLAASAIHSVYLYNRSSPDGAWINAPTLAHLMEQCQSLKTLTLQNLEMDENHCRVLGTFSRPGLEIELSHCRLTSAAAVVLAQVLGRNRGPTELTYCDIDYSILTNGLRGNSRLKSLKPLNFRNRDGFLAIAGALKQNEGLVNLELCHDLMSDETWGAVCDSLKTHPTLEVLTFLSTNNDTPPADITSRIQALLDMMKMNMSIHTIYLYSPYPYSENELFRESVIPHLETNRFRLRVRAIQKTRPSAYRAKVLGRALLAASTDVNRFWMLLSGNVEVVLSSTSSCYCWHFCCCRCNCCRNCCHYSGCFYNWCLCCW